MAALLQTQFELKCECISEDGLLWGSCWSDVGPPMLTWKRQAGWCSCFIDRTFVITAEFVLWIILNLVSFRFRLCFQVFRSLWSHRVLLNHHPRMFQFIQTFGFWKSIRFFLHPLWWWHFSGFGSLTVLVLSVYFPPYTQDYVPNS